MFNDISGDCRPMARGCAVGGVIERRDRAYLRYVDEILSAPIVSWMVAIAINRLVMV